MLCTNTYIGIIQAIIDAVHFITGFPIDSISLYQVQNGNNNNNNNNNNNRACQISTQCIFFDCTSQENATSFGLQEGDRLILSKKRRINLVEKSSGRHHRISLREDNTIGEMKQLAIEIAAEGKLVKI